jgi:hypothetical protein
VVKILSCGEQSVRSDDSSSMQHGIWAKAGAEQPDLRLAASLV